jgi:ubiquinone/menaquinone biosynthesis C-methylase UbiE
VSGIVEFDRIAPVYDETRRPPSESEVQALVEVLAGVRTLLDAGVGTGRFAIPLQSKKLEIVGVDLSIGMMQRARTKGISSLIRADLRRLPLVDDAVDAAFTAHVLQLLPDPREVLHELGRVARRVVVVLLPEWSEMGPNSRWRALRERYRELAAELGYPLPARGQRYRHTLEELSAIATPKLVRQVEGSPSSAPNLSESLARWEGRVSSSGLIPPEVHAEIIRRLQAEHPLDPSRWARPRLERIIAWDANALKGAT